MRPMLLPCYRPFVETICFASLLLFSAAGCQAAVFERVIAPNGGAFPATFSGIPPLNMAYATPEMRGLTVTILGSSKGTEALQQHMAMARQVSDHFLIFPGGPSTLQEASSLIARNHYRGSAPAKRILLVGTDFFSGLREQYDRLHAAGLLKMSPSDLFQVVDSADEILAHFPAAQ